MAAPKGHPKYGGRKKGTPNKSSVPAEAMAKELGIDPFKILLLFANGDWEALGYEGKKRIVGYSNKGDAIEDYTISPDLRAKAASDASQYILPKRKAIEHSGPDGESLNLGVTIYEAVWGNTAEPTDGNANPNEET